ncbi:MerR family transcriptional regulator [Microlunatus ginsengisoli]|uniref:MerR family transcriptional regulator n=1 Tax=Microlunatus ginsengisoli TaxID=363863 RepID=UPI0031D28BC8
MFSIGDFARTGRVSVRMLRHYDAIGLLPPARVDPVTGYRWYDPDQLARLNRIVALKDLGFTLDQVAVMVDGTIDATELRGMLRLRRLELREQIAADTARLARVEARLRVIEKEDAMSTAEITIKTVPATWVAELSAPVAGFEPQHITPVLGPLFDRLMAGLEATGIPCAGAPIAYYEDAVDADGLTVHACAPVPEDTRLDSEGPDSDAVDHLTLTRLPAITAATILHRGVMDDVMPTIQTLGQWIGEHGHRSAGYNREVYLRYGEGMPEPWETELQEPLITG